MGHGCTVRANVGGGSVPALVGKGDALSGQGETVEVSDAAPGVVDAVAFQAAVAEDLRPPVRGNQRYLVFQRQFPRTAVRSAALSITAPTP